MRLIAIIKDPDAKRNTLKIYIIEVPLIEISTASYWNKEALIVLNNFHSSYQSLQHELVALTSFEAIAFAFSECNMFFWTAFSLIRNFNK